MQYLLMIFGILMFSGSIYLLKNYIESIRINDKNPKLFKEFIIFAILIIGVVIFAYGCYSIGNQY